MAQRKFRARFRVLERLEDRYMLSGDSSPALLLPTSPLDDPSTILIAPPVPGSDATPDLQNAQMFAAPLSGTALPFDDSGLAPVGLESLTALPNLTVFNVRDYGAVGDGQTDDTLAIRDALAAAQAAGGGIIYLPQGTYAVARQAGDPTLLSVIPAIFHIQSSNIVFIGDGASQTKLVGYMPGLQDPRTTWNNLDPAGYFKISRFTMFFVGTEAPAGPAIDNVQFRSLMIDGQAGYTGNATVGGIQATGDGWDMTHKAISINGPTPIDHVLIFNSDLANWRGEVVYSGGKALGDIAIVNSTIRSSNASAISTSGNMLLDHSTVGAPGADSVYNGVENLAFTGQHSVVRDSTIQYAGNGMALLGQTGSSALIERTNFNHNRRAILLSEAAPNMTVRDSVFTELTSGAFITSRLGLYPTDLPTVDFDNLSIEGNTFRNAGDVFVSQGQPMNNLRFINNIVGANTRFLTGNFSGSSANWTGFVVDGTTFESGGMDVNSYSGYNFALWTNTTRLPGAIIGYSVNNFVNGTISTISPSSDLTWLNDTVMVSGQQLVILDPNALVGYPVGFRTTFVIGDTNWVLKADPAWNNFAQDVLVTNGLMIELAANGRFSVVSTVPNHAPSGTNATVTTLEDTAYTFTASDFGFSDASDLPANALLAVKIATLPVAGLLTRNGVAVAVGQSITLADLVAGFLRFTPAAGVSGTSYASFTFQVQDDGGTANGGVDLDPTPNTITFNVTSVNDAPSGANKTVTLVEDAIYYFAASDFGFSDVSDSPANALLGVKISTLPAAGSLTRNGLAVTSGQFITLSDLAAGLLRFTCAANAIGTSYASFTFQVQDDGGTANGGADLDPTPNAITFNVTSVNDAPSGANRTVSLLEDSSYIFTANDFGFTDAGDSPANVFLSVKVSNLPAAGALTRNGVAVTAGQFISVADLAAGLLRFTPTAGASGTSYASFTFQVQDDGGTANGGVDLDPTPNAITFNVTSVNDAPSGANKTVSLVQDTAYTFTVSDFGFSDGNDSPASALLGVKITTLPGVGALTRSGVAVTAGQVITLSDLTSGLLRFTPVAGASGTSYASFTFQVQDDGGTANGGVDLDPTPNTISFNVTAETIPPTVTAFNPSLGSANVPTNAVARVTFSESLSAASVTASTVYLRDANNVVIPIALAYDNATKTVSLTPTSALANSTSYTIVVKSGLSGVKDLAGNTLAADASASFTTAASIASVQSLWSDSATPSLLDSMDINPVEVGTRFFSDIDGFITGVRFYKSAANTGIHTGSLWTASGQLLATGTFTNETSSGWQQLIFGTPIAIAAATTYVVSYHTNAGHYSVTNSYFTTQFNNGPLHVPVNGGVYSYDTNVVGRFPRASFQGSNYWVDVLLSTAATDDTTPPTVTSFNPSAGSASVATNAVARVTFSETLNAASVSTSSIYLRDANNVVIPAIVTYDNGTRTVSVTPTNALANSATYTVVVKSGVAGIKDAAGNALANDQSVSFTTAASVVSVQSSLWNDATTPAMLDSMDISSVELGTRFTSDVDGFITGVRFYKSAANSGIHTGSLWSASGQLLATGTFTNETSSGWQQLSFGSPVAVIAGTTYVASYHANMGHYSLSRSYFNTQFNSGALHVPINGGVYSYGAGGFPTQVFMGTNYWVDVLLNTTAPVDTTPPTVTAFSPNAGSTNVAANAVAQVTFSEALSAASVTTSTVYLRDANNVVVPTTVAYDNATKKVSLTPISALANATSYTIVVKGGVAGVKDAAGNALAVDIGSSFITAPPVTAIQASLWSDSALPAIVDGGDTSAVELGTRFTSDLNGFITGVRFYKSVANTGIHTGSLWTATGQLLATGTFANETATGWQTLIFAVPVAITAGTTYVVSYHTNVGHYSVSRSYLNSPLTSGPLHVPANGGVYLYGTGGLPTLSYQASNYWVDALFSSI